MFLKSIVETIVLEYFFFFVFFKILKGLLFFCSLNIPYFCYYIIKLALFSSNKIFKIHHIIKSEAGVYYPLKAIQKLQKKKTIGNWRDNQNIVNSSSIQSFCHG